MILSSVYKYLSSARVDFLSSRALKMIKALDPQAGCPTPPGMKVPGPVNVSRPLLRRAGLSWQLTLRGAATLLPRHKVPLSFIHAGFLPGGQPPNFSPGRRPA
jgi:hypothetical protein